MLSDLTEILLIFHTIILKFIIIQLLAGERLYNVEFVVVLDVRICCVVCITNEAADTNEVKLVIMF